MELAVNEFWKIFKRLCIIFFVSVWLQFLCEKVCVPFFSNISCLKHCEDRKFGNWPCRVWWLYITELVVCTAEGRIMVLSDCYFCSLSHMASCNELRNSHILIMNNAAGYRLWAGVFTVDIQYEKLRGQYIYYCKHLLITAHTVSRCLSFRPLMNMLTFYAIFLYFPEIFCQHYIFILGLVECWELCRLVLPELCKLPGCYLGRMWYITVHGVS